MDDASPLPPEAQTSWTRALAASFGDRVWADVQSIDTCARPTNDFHLSFHFLLLFKNEAKISHVWELPFCSSDVICSRCLCRRDRDQSRVSLSCQSWRFIPGLYLRLIKCIYIETSEWEERPEITETNCEKTFIFWLFTLVNVASANMEEVGLMTFTAAGHQGAIKMV